MQRLHQAEFILRAGTGKNIIALRRFAQLLIIHDLQLTSGNRVPGIANSQHFADAHCRLRVVAGDHFHANARLQAFANSGNGFRTRRVHHSGDTEQNHALLQIRMVQRRLINTCGLPGCRHHT
ncbi:hypothetical protein D3C81_1712780 [compost metagenome]